MDFVLFSIFSSIENIAMFAIMFALFRFEYPFYHANVLFIAVTVSFVSFSMRFGFDIANYASLTSFLLMVLFFSLLFRQHLFYAGITITVSYVIYGVIQIGLMLIFDYLNIIKIADVTRAFSIEGKIIQFNSAVIAMIIYALIKRYKKGFSFIPHTNRVSIQWNAMNLIIMLLLLLTTGLIGAIYYYLNINNYSGYYLFSFVLLFLLGYLIYFSKKKDKLL